MNKKTVVAGLIVGRHSLPVTEYIFDRTIKDVFDYPYIKKVVDNFLESHFDIDWVPVDGDGYMGDTFKIEEGNQLILYVTGLTCATAQVIASCFVRGIEVKLMHYNMATNTFVPQLLTPPMVTHNAEW